MGWGIFVSEDNRSNEIDTSISGCMLMLQLKAVRTCNAPSHPKYISVEWQMTNIEGGLGNKMEDWVKGLHQTRKHQRLRYCTVQNPVVCSLAREKANLCNMHPNAIAQTDKINEGSKPNPTEQKTDLAGMLRKRQRQHVVGGGLRQCHISSRTMSRDSPGRRHYLTTQRRVG
jgi:hypothetical protein